MTQDRQPNEQSSRVPLFGTWRNAYLAVGLFFLLEVSLFYLLDRAFS